MLLHIEWIHSDDLDTDNILFMRHRQTVQAQINVNLNEYFTRNLQGALIKYIYIEMAHQNLKQCIETFYTWNLRKWICMQGVTKNFWCFSIISHFQRDFLSWLELATREYRKQILFFKRKHFVYAITRKHVGSCLPCKVYPRISNLNIIHEKKNRFA